LIYRLGRYFDPTTGVWLMGTGLVLAQAGAKGKRRGKRRLYFLLLLIIFVFCTAASCGSQPPPSLCEEIVGEPVADGYMVFVNNAKHIDPSATEWPTDKMDTVKQVYDDAILNGYAGPKGFGSLDRWGSAFGISRAKPNGTNAGGAIRLIYKPEKVAHAGWNQTPLGRIPSVDFGDARVPVADTYQAYHELAHVWDGAQSSTLHESMSTAMGVKETDAGRVTDIEHHGNFPTSYAATGGVSEDFADSVAAYFLMKAENDDWADDDPRSGYTPDANWYPPDRMDRHDYLEKLFASGR
jgi:hypothetical protein